MRINYVFFLAIFFLLVGVAFAGVAVKDSGTYVGEATAIDIAGDNTVTFDGSTATITTGSSPASSYKYAYMPVSGLQLSAGMRPDGFITSGIATALTANGVETSSVLEIGSTEGFIVMNDSTDYIIFYMNLPETFYYDGTAADLTLGLDLSEGAAHAGTDTWTVTYYEDGLETGAMISQNLSMNATARGWVEDTAIGADASITGANKVLIIKVAPSTSNDDGRLYGMRLKYRPGIDFD
jgi:hypothetical protein